MTDHEMFYRLMAVTKLTQIHDVLPTPPNAPPPNAELLHALKEIEKISQAAITAYVWGHRK